MDLLDSLREAEHRLQRAQRASDVDELDRLLHDDLTFVGPDGVLSGKDVDLQVHRDGTLRVTSLDVESLHEHVVGSTGVTVLTAQLSGRYRGQDFTGRMRYTRAWAHDGHGWRVVGAHASAVPDDVL